MYLTIYRERYIKKYLLIDVPEALFRSGPRNSGLARKISFVEGVCVFSAGALRIRVLTNIEMQQRCAKMKPKANNNVPKRNPKWTKGYQNGHPDGIRVIKRKYCEQGPNKLLNGGLVIMIWM